FRKIFLARRVPLAALLETANSYPGSCALTEQAVSFLPKFAQSVKSFVFGNITLPLTPRHQVSYELRTHQSPRPRIKSVSGAPQGNGAQSVSSFTTTIRIIAIWTARGFCLRPHCHRGLMELPRRQSPPGAR